MLVDDEDDFYLRRELTDLQPEYGESNGLAGLNKLKLSKKLLFDKTRLVGYQKQKLEKN